MMVIDGKNPEKEIPQNPLDGAKKEVDQASQELIKDTVSDLASLKGEARGNAKGKEQGDMKSDVKSESLSKNIDKKIPLDVAGFKNELAGLKGGIDTSKQVVSESISASVSETTVQSPSSLEKKTSVTILPEDIVSPTVSPFVAKYAQKEFAPYLATSTRDPEVQQAHVQAAKSLLTDLDVSDPNVFADPLRRIARQLLS